MIRALERFGGILIRPRATAAALPADEGERDGMWLTLIYLAGTSLQPLAEGLAGMLTLANLGGVLMVASGLGRAILAPILVLVLCEVLLGNDRGHRRGLMLVPFILVGIAAHTAWLAGVHLPGPGYAPLVLGAVGSIVLTLAVRGSVPREATA